MIRSMTDIRSLANYLQRIGAEARSLRTAVVKEVRGNYWRDVAVIRIDVKDGSIDAPEGYEPTDSEAAVIAVDVMAADWPHSKKLGASFELPEELKKADPEDLFELRDRNGSLIMIQQRIEKNKKGERRYVPWSYWTDNEWRKAEPEGSLPLYGLEKLEDNSTVFIHEGAKAARAIARLIEPRTAEEKEALAEHPWGKELSGAAHIGWIGGALSPARTDWSELAKAGVKRAYIVADNDKPGKAAIPKIAQRLSGLTVFSLEFTESFPASFDLADAFPKDMFKKQVAEQKEDLTKPEKDKVFITYYVGPDFRSLLHPATWATDLEPNPSAGNNAKPIPALRSEFVDLWIWVDRKSVV